MVKFWGRSARWIGSIIKATESFLYRKWCWLLQGMDVDRIKRAAPRFVAAIGALCPDKLCWGFVDGTCRQGGTRSLCQTLVVLYAAYTCACVLAATGKSAAQRRINER